MVRIIASLLLTLALSFSVAFADTASDVTQLMAGVTANAASKTPAPVGTPFSVTIDGISYSVTVDSLGNITATGPAGAAIQTIAISTGPVGTNTNVPLAVTIITAAGGISSLNIGTDSNGNISSVSTAGETITVGTTTTVTSSSSTAANGTNATLTDTFSSSTSIGGGGSVTGTVSVTFAPGTSPLSLTVVSPH